MTIEPATPLPEERRFRRILGRYASGRPGPTLFVTGGLHGNEPAGVLAAQRVLDGLKEALPELRGEVWFVAGNLEALAANHRYIDTDLNRCWTHGRVRDIRSRPPEDDGVEDAEQRALLSLLDEAKDRGSGPLILLDLHTTSGMSAPFALMGDSLRNRRLALSLPVPVILGLEETIRGTLIDYAGDRGYSALVVEAGQHADPLAVDLHEAVIWLTIHSAGLLDAVDIPHHREWRRRLRAACAGLPRVVEVRYRHQLRPGDDFRMDAGRTGFESIEAGESLARDRRGVIKAPERGRLLMPLYQKKGTDGFFIVRPVHRFWLWVSKWMRRLRFDVALPLLPGVRRHPERPDALLVNPRIARIFPVEIFHLLGYRRRRPGARYLVFTRRR